MGRRTYFGVGGGVGAGGVKGLNDMNVFEPEVSPRPKVGNRPPWCGPFFSSSAHSASLYFFTHDTALLSADVVKIFIMNPGTKFFSARSAL